MRYEITRRASVPDAMAEAGMVERIVVEAGAAHLPFPSEIEERGGVAEFGSFKVELMPGDQVRLID